MGGRQQAETTGSSTAPAFLILGKAQVSSSTEWELTTPFRPGSSQDRYAGCGSLGQGMPHRKLSTGLKGLQAQARQTVMDEMKPTLMENIPSPADLQDSAHTCPESLAPPPGSTADAIQPRVLRSEDSRRREERKGHEPQGHAAPVKGRWVEKARALRQGEAQEHTLSCCRSQLPPRVPWFPTDGNDITSLSEPAPSS